MRIAITGSSGLLGSHMVEFYSKKFQVLAIDRNKRSYQSTNIKMEQIDLLNFSELKSSLIKFNPDVIINSAAHINVDKCEIEKSYSEKINGHLPIYICNHFKNKKFIQISTDAVYGNNVKSSKDENDDLIPNNVYSKTKLIGENILENSSNLVIRTCPYGWSPKEKLTFAEWIYSAIMDESEISMFQDVYFTPIYVPFLIKYIDFLIINDIGGIFNIGGSQVISKYEFALTMAKILNKNFTKIINKSNLEDHDFIAERSKDLSLNSNKFFKIYNKNHLKIIDELRIFLSHKNKEIQHRFQI